MHVPKSGQWASLAHDKFTRKMMPAECECFGSVLAIAEIIEQTNGPTTIAGRNKCECSYKLK